MDYLNLDAELIRKMADKLATKDFGVEDGIEKRMVIDGTELYALTYGNDEVQDIPGIKDTNALEWADRTQLHAVVTFAAYEHYMADSDWIWDHFGERSALCDIDGCQRFAGAFSESDTSIKDCYRG